MSTLVQYDSLESALLDQDAAILVHGEISCDGSGHSRARQKVYTSQGHLLYHDRRIRSYWYMTENERIDLQNRGGLILGITR